MRKAALEGGARNRSAYAAMLGLYVFGAGAVGELWRRLTGKKRNPYWIINIVSWTPGGLTVSALGRIYNLGRSFIEAASAPREERSNKIDRFIREFTTAARLFMPYWEVGNNILSAITDTPSFDAYVLHRLREALDSAYRVSRARSKANRTPKEKVQVLLFGGRPERQRQESSGRRRPIRRR